MCVRELGYLQGGPMGLPCANTNAQIVQCCGAPRAPEGPRSAAASERRACRLSFEAAELSYSGYHHGALSLDGR